MEGMYESSGSSLNHESNFKPYLEDLELTFINQAEEFMKDFCKLANLVEFKQLVEDFEIKLPEDVLVKALELLSDISFFKYHSKSTIIRFEVHLRTWMTTLERLYYSPIVLSRETREQLYNRLGDFVKFHHNMTNVFRQGVNNSFKSKAKSNEIANNNNGGGDDDIYMYFQNYNINFLLIHLRDTLHSMRDDETCSDEILRRIRDFLLTFIQISPIAANTASGNISIAFGFAEIFPNIAKVFNFKYPITYWYPMWRELLSVHYSLENLTKDKDYSKLRFYNEIYLLELLWQYIFNLSIDQAAQKEILNNQNEILEILNLWTKKEPTAPPNSLCLALCYYLGLELLQKSKCSYICFKSLELLLTLSYKKPELFEDIIQDDILQLNAQLNTQLTKQSSLANVKEGSKIEKNDLLSIIAAELTCPITNKMTGDFSILTCGHSISSYAIKKWKEVTTIEKRLFECPFCKNKIELKSTYNLPKNKILEGLYNRLEQGGYFDKLPEERQISPKEIYTIEDNLFLKFNKYKIFRTFTFSKLSAPIFQKIQPKVMMPAFNKAFKAEYQEDHTAVILWLTQVLQQRPKSYSTRFKAIKNFGLYL
ncbi:11293_t:CDS:2 [Dentiscutata erythropus]|uniref:11293_t:CDS:1 n=1 Tax=Dentiscutata erythropus TaxID=1348616 RepID=A0A9N8YPE3_9GLOM|nr:11293_t:CDS:2 [Dentiscutata erythropus]